LARGTDPTTIDFVSVWNSGGNYISAPTFITIADDELKYRAVAERSAQVSPRKKLQITIGVTRSRKNYDYLTKSPAESYPVAAAWRPKKVEITKIGGKNRRSNQP